MQSIQEQVRAFVIESFLFGNPEEGFDDETSFLESRIIDSTGILELVAFLENTYGITIDDHELDPSNLDTLNRIATFVERKRAGQ